MILIVKYRLSNANCKDVNKSKKEKSEK